MNIKEIVNTVIDTSNSAFFYTPPIYGKSNSYLFLSPEEKITIKSVRNIDEKLKQVDKFIENGFYGYSLFNYEAGYLFEKSLNKYLPRDEKLIQFFFYDKKNVQLLKSSNIKFDFDEKFKVNRLKLNTSKKEFSNSIKKIKSFIEEGDTYQVNYTVKGKFNFDGSLAGLFSNLVFNQSAKYIALINNYSNIIISLSPELFFEVKGKNIISKPMKGTAKRGIENKDDSLLRYELEESKKNRAENVMIVDMIRNDLGKISEFNSVKTTKLFEVEKYESVYQMVSTIESKLKREVHLSDVIKNIFPCASITGAPKIRTMKIIKEIEKEDRGIYTGAIGLIGKNKILFNVPIRTLSINKMDGKGAIGLGSGIVWDSKSDEEYSETLLKGKFLSHPVKPFNILETMLVKNGNIFLLKEHLDRMQQAAEYFLFCFDRNKTKNKLLQIARSCSNESKRLRIELSKDGKISYSISELPSDSGDVKIIISKKKIDSKNKFQYFKTTNRNIYNSEFKKYSAKGFFDVIFINERRELAEGCITNIFIEKNGIILTPPKDAGILPGIYRKYFLNNNSSIVERRIQMYDLLEADKIILTNSVRGEVIVNKLFITENEFIGFKRQPKEQ